jgi:hypothetical protein
MLTLRMSAAFFERVHTTVHSLVQQVSSKLEIKNISYFPVGFAVRGALFRYHLNNQGTYREVLDCLASITATLDEVVVSFVEADCIYLKIGFDAFDAVGVDGGKKSSLWDMLNAPPLESQRRPQWVCIGKAPARYSRLPCIQQQFRSL